MHFLLLRDALECLTRTKSHFSLVRSRLFYLVYMQLLVFFTLLFRTPYILYIFWIIYISSYTKVHIFFSLRACYGILQFYGQWRSTHCVEIISEKHCFYEIFTFKHEIDWLIWSQKVTGFFFEIADEWYLKRLFVYGWHSWTFLDFSWLFRFFRFVFLLLEA